MEAVIGLDLWGFEHILGLRQGESEHATVVGELLSDLQSRGLSLDAPRLYVLDGSKALRQALDRYELQRYAGQLHMEAAFRDAYDEVRHDPCCRCKSGLR